jgi:hypothetical protein
MKTNKVIWLDGDNVFVVRKGKTTNAKISDGSHLVQTYTFSVKQWELATTQKGFGIKAFFALDQANCLDCPFSMSNGNGGCYTHKFQQYVGFVSLLRSIKREDLSPFNDLKFKQLVQMSMRSYVRFGTYGEPSLIDKNVVAAMVAVAKTWTGYTHQWAKPWAQKYGDYFMASVHNQAEAEQAKSKSYRSFIASNDNSEDAVSCPASKEAGFKSNCASCGLCSGMTGKGKKDIKILKH